MTHILINVEYFVCIYIYCSIRAFLYVQTLNHFAMRYHFSSITVWDCRMLRKWKKKSEVVKVNKKYLTRLLKRSRIKRYSESYSSRRMPVLNVDSPVEYYTLSTSRNILNETVYMSISYVIRATVHLKVNSLLIAVPYIHIELVPCANQNVHVQLVV